MFTLLLLALSARADADDRWRPVLELPAAFPLSQPQRSLFGAGALPAISLYRPLSPHLLGGVRLRAGAFANGPAPADRSLRDPGVGGLGTLSIAVRARPLPFPQEGRARGPWLEVAGGAGFTGRLLRVTAEVGAGWHFRAGPRLRLGPTVRYLQVIQPADALEGRDARIGLVGLEALLEHEPPPPPAPLPEIEIRVVDADHDGIIDRLDRCPHEPEDLDGFQDDDGCPDPDNDGDGITDDVDRCPDQAETVNGVEDQDGCPDVGLIVLIRDRVSLEERVVFDNRHRVRASARPYLAAVIELWHQHPDWNRLIVEGHSDAAGADPDDDWLAGPAAGRLRSALVKLGMPAQRLQLRADGRPRSKRSRPLAPQTRRVELIVGKAPPAPAPPVSPPGLSPDEIERQIPPPGPSL
jgi:outer membrane protein OmpA-like peptidoglycan-associated protein